MTAGNAFISYRREDTAGYAGRIYDRLNARFPDRVFMDVTRLDPGVDFVEEIQKAVGSCSVLIALIGRNWAVSTEGIPRLQDPLDFVRLEVGHALERKIRVIPVLVGGATIPTPDVLPPEIGALLRRQVLKLDDSAFDYNVSQLIDVIEKDAPPTPTEPRKWRWIGVGVIVAVGLLVSLIGALVKEFSAPVDPQLKAAVSAPAALGSEPASTPQGPPVRPRPWSEAQAVLTLNDGRVVNVRAETLSNCITPNHGLDFTSGQSVAFDKIKSFDVLRADAWLAPNARANLRISFLDGGAAEESVPAGCDLFGYNDRGRFATYLENLRRVEFQR